MDQSLDVAVCVIRVCVVRVWMMSRLGGLGPEKRGNLLPGVCKMVCKMVAHPPESGFECHPHPLLSAMLLRVQVQAATG